jgi:hypothetical protein
MSTIIFAGRQLSIHATFNDDNDEPSYSLTRAFVVK